MRALIVIVLGAIVGLCAFRVATVAPAQEVAKALWSKGGPTSAGHECAGNDAVVSGGMGCARERGKNLTPPKGGTTNGGIANECCVRGAMGELAPDCCDPDLRDACLHCYSHCKRAMEDRDCGRCDQAVEELRKTLKEVEASGDPPDIPDAVWKRHQEEAPVIYGMAIAGCYMQRDRCKEALDEFERAGKALQTCVDICATSPGICRLKVDLTSKVILPMCEADCAIALSQHEKAKALLDSASEYLPGGRRESQVCPFCRSDWYYSFVARKVSETLASVR